MSNDNITVDRETAAKINPLISNLWTEDTLGSLAGVVEDLGYFLSISANPPEGNDAHFGRLYLLFDAISAAISYEASNPKLCKSNLDKQGGSHD